MKAIVVYESLWGNTAAVARAIAEGIGEGVPVLSTAEATADAIAGADLLVVGAPLIAFGVPSESRLAGIRANPPKQASPPDLSQPPMRSWLDALPPGSGRSAAFETRFRWSPGGATGGIERALRGAGYPPIAKGRRFIIKGTTGPLRDGELDKAREWGAELAAAMAQAG